MTDDKGQMTNKKDLMDQHSIIPPLHFSRMRWIRLIMLLVSAASLLACAHAKKTTDNAPVEKKEWNNVHFGPATYNQGTRGFEDPWPFGPGP
jgi:hypothetical protein